MQPPVLSSVFAIVFVSQGLDVLSDILKRQLVQRGVRFWHINKIHKPAVSGSLHHIPANQAPLYNVRIRFAIRIKRRIEHFLSLFNR
jgi:hypothetical protein